MLKYVHLTPKFYNLQDVLFAVESEDLQGVLQFLLVPLVVVVTTCGK